MARTDAHRKYQLTINNPEEHGFSHEVIKRILEGFSGIIYWCLCDETGENGTYHTHVYAAFKNPVEFQSMCTRFHGMHIESARGTHRENRDYIRKEGKYRDTEKALTNHPETFEESDDLPPESERRVKTTEAILGMLEAGATDAEILREFPSAMNHMQHINEARQTLLEERFRKDFRELHVSYIWGKTGVGKTRSVMERYGYENVYRVTNYSHPFDGYRGENVIMFDEFRSSLPLADMLKYLDGYFLMLPCRYADRAACYKEVYIVSNISLDKQYPSEKANEPESYEAFRRRINDVWEMLSDDTELPF